MSELEPDGALIHVYVAMEACNSTLGWGALAIAADELQPDPSAVAGAYLGISCERRALLVGVTGSTQSLSSLAKLMLGLEAEDEPPDGADVAGAVGDVVVGNAGSVHHHIAEPAHKGAAR